jgi:mono/diheme cytochrome c family protein
MAALTACQKAERDAARTDNARGVETGTVATPIDSQQLRTTVDSLSLPQASDSAARGQGPDRANEIARAPRGNPNAPPKPKITPDEPGSSSDTTPTKPDSAPKPKDSSGTQSKGTAAGSELRDQYHPAPRDTVSQVVYTGWKYFNLNCARCHGEDVTGTTIAPHLVESFNSGKVDRAEYWRVVHGSRAERGMPNWSGLIDDDKLEAIYQYVKGRSEGKLHPGRPAQRGT